MKRAGFGVRIAIAIATFALVGALTTASASAGMGTKCPSTFRVLNNDTIDKVSFRKGNYTVRVKRMSCQSASNYFKQFLAANQNNLPKGWRLFKSRLKFKNKKLDIAFRVKRVSGGGGGGGGGGSGGGSTTGKCPGTFRVLNNDTIDKVSFPKGNYTIKVKRTSCQSASNYLKQFLASAQNKLPKGWRLYESKLKFRNKKMNIAFRVKQVS